MILLLLKMFSSLQVYLAYRRYGDATPVKSEYVYMIILNLKNQKTCFCEDY